MIKSLNINLSTRQREAVVLIASEYSFKRAAELLGISRRTFEKHLVEAKKKLGLRDRVQITRYALANNLINNRFKV